MDLEAQEETRRQVLVTMFCCQIVNILGFVSLTVTVLAPSLHLCSVKQLQKVKMGVTLSFVTILFLWGRGQKGFSGSWLKDMLFWEKGFVFACLGKVIRVFTPSRVIWIRYDEGRPPKD